MILIGWAHRNFFRCTLNLRHDSALDHWCLFALAWLPLALRHAQLRRLAPEQRQGPRSRRRPQTASGSIGRQAPSGSYMVALVKPCEPSKVLLNSFINSMMLQIMSNYVIFIRFDSHRIVSDRILRIAVESADSLLTLIPPRLPWSSSCSSRTDLVRGADV